MRIVELLAFAPLSAPQLAAALQAHPRTVRRVLSRLVDEDYVTQTDERRRLYAPTMRMVALAGQIVENSELARRARPYVTLMAERAGATAHLLVPSYQSALCLVHSASTGGDVRPRLRELVPAHCTAGGKALLAWRDPWRDSVLAAPLARYTDRTVVDPEALRRELETVRRDGHAHEDGEYQAGVLAVAAPVLSGGTAVAALTVSGTGLDVARIIDSLGPAARDLADDVRAES